MRMDGVPRPGLFARADVLVIVAIAAALLAVGSFADLPFSTAAYDPGAAWGIGGAAIGAWSAAFAILVGGVFLIRGRNPERRGRALGQAITGGLLALLGTVFVAVIPTMYLDLPNALVIAVGVVLSAGAFAGSWRLAGRLTPRELIRYATGLALLVVAQLVVINLVKIGWARPRMRMLVDNPDIAFQPWWSPGSPEKASALAGGIRGQEFKSFPSGHAANAAVLMYLLPLLAWLSTGLRRFARPALYVGFAWALAVALSRIVVGAHFITDVTVGLTVPFLLALLIHRLVSASPGAARNGLQP